MFGGFKAAAARCGITPQYELIMASELSERFLTGEKVCLRRLQPGDLEFLYRWENDPAVWQYGDCGGNGCCDELASTDSQHDCSMNEARVGTPSNNISPSVVADMFPLSSSERFSREELREFIENQRYDIFITGQMRLVICHCDSTIGFIDLFDLDPIGLSAGVGILICDPAHRGNGYGRESLELIIKYAQQVIGLNKIWCNIAADNCSSLALFSGAGFVRTEVCLATNIT